MTKLSVGYLVDDGYQSEQIYSLVRESKLAQYYSIDYLIVQKFDEDTSLSKNKVLRYFTKHGFIKLVSRVLLEATFVLEKLIFIRDSKLKDIFNAASYRYFQREENKRPSSKIKKWIRLSI